MTVTSASRLVPADAQASGKLQSLLRCAPTVQTLLCEQLQVFFRQKCGRAMPSMLVVAVHESAAIAHGLPPRRHPDVVTARASPDFHGSPWFSCLAIQDEQPDEPTVDRFCRVLLFLSLSLDGIVDGAAASYKLALVEYFNVIDHSLPVPLLEKSGRWGMVDISCILRLVHIVPRHATVDQFLLNVYMGTATE